MASVARKNLFEDIPRFLVAQAGIMFAVSLVTIQTGILNGFSRSTSALIDDSEVDIWVSAEEMVNLQLTLPIPAATVSEIHAMDGVEQAEAFISRTTTWRSPTGDIAPVQMIGFDPASRMFRMGQLTEGAIANLQEPYTVIPDRANLGALGLDEVGQSASINSLPVTITGFTRGTQSIASSAYVFASLRTANAYLNSGLTTTSNCQLEGDRLTCSNMFERDASDIALDPPRALRGSDGITFVMVKAQPGQDLNVLSRRIEAEFDGMVAHTQTELSTLTRNYWVGSTGIGFVLGLGAGVGVVVGVVIVSQILYASVVDHMKEFGTLKAMGASDWMIYRIIIEQALWMAILGYIPSIALCGGLGWWTFATQGITILITPGTAVVVLGITVGMCVVSALFAIQKVTHVDPAIVFKA
ncbi:MAG: ABC transporter permease [Kaiparowitsia implicata GSE-PSE-MK54-09C]|jgi:putative ABC transport system permease protein|nr:ABC transporter permease [Kaiparowitsia implicata GSE-PSE-MK54-09C]